MLMHHLFVFDCGKDGLTVRIICTTGCNFDPDYYFQRRGQVVYVDNDV